MFTFLAFAFFFFLGFLAMFIYSERRRENLARIFCDEHAQLRVLLRAIESRLDHLETGAETARTGNKGQTPANQVAMEKEISEYDPLLHLSFDDPGAKEPDLNLELSGEANFSQTKESGPN